MKINRAVMAALVLSLGISGQALAQNQEEEAKQETDPSSVSDNPFLRKRAPAAQKQAAPTMTDKDKNFLLKAATAGDEEIALGKLGQQHAQSAETKRVAAAIVADHTKMNKDLLALAESKGLRIGTQTMKPGKISPQGFDKVFLDAVADHHQKDIALFQKHAASGDDKDIRAFAAKSLPALRGHLAMIKKAKAGAK